jgi:hypothetical protein
VLSFIIKPDVSYYGGTTDNLINVYEPLGISSVSGTSFAAPWIARKLSYLIDILGFNREIAKAMIVDSAIGWNEQKLANKALIGHGVVPIKIDDIVRTPKNEIKFVLSGVAEKYSTFNYNFPVPIHKEKYPYIAKATLCYFPKCTRNQGVDYTNTEFDLYFGRIKKDDTIDSINKNMQSIEDGDFHAMFEEDARKYFRKWDNVKHIQNDQSVKNPMPKDILSESKMWGMMVKSKERLEEKDGTGVRFGIVVTLKEINNVNRIDEFIQLCSLRGWLVNKIDIANRIDIYQTANENIELE